MVGLSAVVLLIVAVGWSSGSPAPPAYECVKGYEKYSLSHVNGADGYMDITEEMACLDKCTELPECLAWEWNFHNPPFDYTRCWIHGASSLDENPMRGNQRVHHYKKNLETCPVEEQQNALPDGVVGYSLEGTTGFFGHHGFSLPYDIKVVGNGLNLPSAAISGFNAYLKSGTKTLSLLVSVVSVDADQVTEKFTFAFSVPPGNEGVVSKAIGDEGVQTTGDPSLAPGDMFQVWVMALDPESGIGYRTGSGATCGTSYTVQLRDAHQDVYSTIDMPWVEDADCMELALQAVLA